MKIPAILVALAVLSAYSTACVSARQRAKGPRPLARPLESVLMVAVFVYLLFLPAALRGLRLLLVYVMLAAAVGALMGLVRRSRGSAGTREFEECGSRERTSAWQRWLGFSRSVADYEVRLILSAAYLILVGPLAIAYQFANRSRASSNSNWQPRSDVAPSLEIARRPF